MTSDTERRMPFLPLLVRTRMSSKPAVKMLPMAKISMIMMIGEMQGSVTRKICLIRPAPSMDAASYRAGSTPEIAARYKMEAKPTSFQMPVPTRTYQNYSAIDSQFTGSPMTCRLISSILRLPLSTDRMDITMPATITHDIKWGKYVIV